MSTLETQYENFLKEHGNPKVSYEDWLKHLSKQLTDALYKAKTEKLQYVKANDWKQATVWRDEELRLEEQLKEPRK